MFRFISNLPRESKRLILLIIDVMLIPFALLGAVLLQQPESFTFARLADNWAALLLLMMSGILLAVTMGTHKIQLKAYESRAIGLTGIYSVLLGLVAAIMDDLAGYGTALATFINFGIIYFLAVVMARVLMLKILLGVYRSGANQCRVLIYGAGRTGRQLAAALRTDEQIFPLAFVDDNTALQGTIVNGLRVYSPVVIGTMADNHQIDRVLLAMPSMPRHKQALLSRRMEDIGLGVQSLPSFAQLTGQEALVEQLESIIPDRFLGRAPLDEELPGRSEIYAGCSILITGAGGSIGSELCRQLLVCKPRVMVLLDISEHALYRIDMELNALAKQTKTEIIPVLGSIMDANLIRKAMAESSVEIVLHAAAYKHVPLVERNAVVGLSNNVLGTQALALAAIDMGVKRFILISSDKAVRPKNMMGASKRLAEIVVQDLASRSKEGTVFSIVRFGNVMGSSGSVIPLFQDQIKKGGPVTLTHREVTRYFMTISEAARLVLVAGTFANGGDVFVLDMGDPIPIYNLAWQMIAASGYTLRDEMNPKGDIEIVITGLRPGEKIHEELLIGEGQITTQHPKILQARETYLSEIEVAVAIKALQAAIADSDEMALRQVIARWVEDGESFLSNKKRPTSG